MSIFGQTVSVGEYETDHVGYVGPIPTGVYTGTIKHAFLGKSASSKAQSVTIIIEMSSGQTVEETIYVTNRKAETFYVKNNKQHTLPGYLKVDSLLKLLLSKSLSDITNTTTIELERYNYEQKKRVPTPVECITELHGQQVTVALTRLIEDKNVKDPNTNQYVPSGETRKVNTFTKFCHPVTGATLDEAISYIQNAPQTKNMSVVEMLQKGYIHQGAAKVPVTNVMYIAQFEKENTGQDLDKSTVVSAPVPQSTSTSGFSELSSSLEDDFDMPF